MRSDCCQSEQTRWLRRFVDADSDSGEGGEEYSLFLAKKPKISLHLLVNILSIQSHVCYGCVGNKAAVYPLQSMGFDVWPIHTVQFSNHTGHGTWKGQVHTAAHVQEVIDGLRELHVLNQCQAVLSGYLGDSEVGDVIVSTVQDLKKENPNIVYLCDPVMGDTATGCFVRPGVVDFFKTYSLNTATLLTPNHFEAEILFGREITTIDDAAAAGRYFMSHGVKVVVIKTVPCDEAHTCSVLISDKGAWAAYAPKLRTTHPLSGTGDLFSALFLGYFLKICDEHVAWRAALQTVREVIADTQRTDERELRIVGRSYTQPEAMSDIRCECLSEELCHSAMLK